MSEVLELYCTKNDQNYPAAWKGFSNGNKRDAINTQLKHSNMDTNAY